MVFCAWISKYIYFCFMFVFEFLISVLCLATFCLMYLVSCDVLFFQSKLYLKKGSFFSNMQKAVRNIDWKRPSLLFCFVFFSLVDIVDLKLICDVSLKNKTKCINFGIIFLIRYYNII